VAVEEAFDLAVFESKVLFVLLHQRGELGIHITADDQGRELTLRQAFQSSKYFES
jgi:hypothetical protein